MTVSLQPSEAEVLAAQALESMAATQNVPLDPSVKVIAGATLTVNGYEISLTDEQAEALRVELAAFVAARPLKIAS